MGAWIIAIATLLRNDSAASDSECRGSSGATTIRLLGSTAVSTGCPRSAGRRGLFVVIDGS